MREMLVTKIVCALLTLSTRRPDADGMRSFAHGTSLAYAQEIVATGIDAEATTAASFGSNKISVPGSFHTHELGPPSNPGLGLEAAFLWAGNRFGKEQAAVVIINMPEEMYQDLEKSGLVRVESVPGFPGFPNQTVFLPDALSILNQFRGIWQILP